jgi:anti-sigma regulatory factor (Ser/Thr protein kinase)
MTRGSTLASVGHGGHAVHFYGTDDQLAVSVSAYLAEGIQAGGAAIVVATAPHREAFEAALAEAGVDVARERDAGRLLVAGAAETLGRFLGGDGLDRARFESVISRLVQRAGAGGRPVRIYGEMVAVLWDAGHVALALELETLWNELGARLPFTLLCGYPAQVTSDPGTADAVREVRRLHSEVIATASGSGTDSRGGAADAGGAGPVTRTRSFTFMLDSVRAARHFAAGLLGQGPGEALANDAAIVVTELAANAVLHARSGFTLTISRSAAAVTIAVKDDRPLAPGSDGMPFEIKAGHGLSVVAQLASRWAVERRPDGKVVWAEVPAG